MKQALKQDRDAEQKPPIGAILVAGLAFAVMTAGWTLSFPSSTAVETRAENELSTERVEQIVYEYLTREPQVVYEVVEELQRRERAERTDLAALDHADGP